MHTSQTGLGFNPFHTITKAAKGVAHATTSAAKATGHGVAVGARATGHGVVKVAKTVEHGAIKAGEFAVAITLAPIRLALRPVTSRVRTLTNRRANKIAWDKRKSKTPTPAEKAQAKAWTKSQLKKKLPHGPLLAMLAGPLPMPTGLGAMSTNLGVAPAVIVALVPVFIEILNALLKSFARSGEAPVQIGPNGQPLMPVDPTVVPDAAADEGPPPGADAGAMVPGGDDAAAAADDGGGGGGMPGGKKGNLIVIGGLVVGFILVASLFKKKPASKK